MQIDRNDVQRFLGSFTCSFLLFCVWGTFTVLRGRSLLAEFNTGELLWFLYNVTISLLFLVRSKPSVVSLDLVHWIVAGATSFSGFAFSKTAPADAAFPPNVANGIMLAGVVIGIVAALALGRSYGVVPALRRVKTGSVYHVVRHPMYTSSLVIKVGYLLRHPSIYNVLLLVLVAVLYDLRARYEEKLMSLDASYVDYMRRVRYRFLPTVY